MPARRVYAGPGGRRCRPRARKVADGHLQCLSDGALRGAAAHATPDCPRDEDGADEEDRPPEEEDERLERGRQQRPMRAGEHEDAEEADGSDHSR